MSFNYKKYLNIYEAEVELPSSKEIIKIKPLTTNHMKKLLVYENEKDASVGEKVLDEILSMSILDENYDIDNMYLQDRYFLFIEIRKLTKGSIHTYTFTCPKCKNQSIQKIDLNNLEIHNLKDDIDYTIKVLNDQLTLNMKFPTRKDQKEAFSVIDKNLSDTEKQIEMILSNLAQCIKSIDTPDGKEENLSIKDKMEFVGDLPATDYDSIKEWFNENDFGIDLKIKVKCNDCEYESIENMEMTNFFQ